MPYAVEVPFTRGASALRLSIYVLSICCGLYLSEASVCCRSTSPVAVLLPHDANSVLNFYFYFW
jgi:hypothetical protein